MNHRSRRCAAIRGRAQGWLARWNRPPTRRQLGVLVAIAGLCTAALLPVMAACIAYTAARDTDLQPMHAREDLHTDPPAAILPAEPPASPAAGGGGRDLQVLP
ncbi:hypothetical protein ABT297_24890 [Dactylosporangium sp. NPDC000555]|uniref:hypothetical protein n=1 Tax=Dactylosporangium sp. NPDC000555 TaxID=3154260 RepID=UPI003332EC8E